MSHFLLLDGLFEGPVCKTDLYSSAEFSCRGLAVACDLTSSPYAHNSTLSLDLERQLGRTHAPRHGRSWEPTIGCPTNQTHVDPAALR